jgi:transposase
MPNTNLRNSNDFSGENFYVGIDVHKKSWSVTVRGFELEVTHFTQPPVPEVLASTLHNKFPAAILHSAFEAGFSGTSTHTQLCKLGIDNIIINPADIPATDKQKKNKTDLHDSRAIAKYLEKGLLHGIHVLSEKQQELRSLYRLRETKVREKTRATNRLKSYLMYMGIPVPENFTESKGIPVKMAKWLGTVNLTTAAGTLCLKQYLQEYKDQRVKLNFITKELKKFVEQSYSDPYKQLLTLPGYGPLVSIALLTEIGDFGRFKDTDQYNSYLGLIPWEDSSGDTTRNIGAQPRCNKHIRPMLVEAAWQAIRRDSGFLAYYKKHYTKGNKHAIMKVARKLALCARAVVLNNTPYDPDYLKKTNEKEIKNKPKKIK